MSNGVLKKTSIGKINGKNLEDALNRIKDDLKKHTMETTIVGKKTRMEEYRRGCGSLSKRP